MLYHNIKHQSTMFSNVDEKIWPDSTRQCDDGLVGKSNPKKSTSALSCTPIRLNNAPKRNKSQIGHTSNLGRSISDTRLAVSRKPTTSNFKNLIASSSSSRLSISQLFQTEFCWIDELFKTGLIKFLMSLLIHRKYQIRRNASEVSFNSIQFI